ncbi:YqaJ viral recombinase family protein [Rathayibacter sp. VKM Ac-2630]|uniref:YqaJ viral recombinase family protein n=1 Tax=Rathayibacter sp. VKM Ac-2630 TaxID=1938617 RepID=UPI00191BF686|nr:YqaJ viral recombinase family protein [Rathayibacter sp. VKM Ac-2630]
MNVQIFETLEQGTPEWLATRCGLLTASNMWKLVTPTLKVADNDTSRGLTHTLAAERITGEVEYVYPSFDMQRGTEEEPIARAVYAESYGAVDEVGFILRTGKDYRLGYSPDGLIGSDGLLEIKSRKPKEHIKTILSGKPPAENMAQLMTGLMVTGRKWIDYASFSAGLPLWTVRVYPDAAWFAAIEAAAQAFETNIADVIDRYTRAVEGLPATERRLEVEDLIF